MENNKKIFLFLKHKISKLSPLDFQAAAEDVTNKELQYTQNSSWSLYR